MSRTSGDTSLLVGCVIVLYRAVLCWVWRTPFVVFPNAQISFLVFCILSVAKRLGVREHRFWLLSFSQGCCRSCKSRRMWRCLKTATPHRAQQLDRRDIPWQLRCSGKRQKKRDDLAAFGRIAVPSWSGWSSQRKVRLLDSDSEGTAVFGNVWKCWPNDAAWLSRRRYVSLIAHAKRT